MWGIWEVQHALAQGGRGREVYEEREKRVEQLVRARFGPFEGTPPVAGAGSAFVFLGPDAWILDPGILFLCLFFVCTITYVCRCRSVFSLFFCVASFVIIYVSKRRPCEGNGSLRHSSYIRNCTSYT